MTETPHPTIESVIEDIRDLYRCAEDRESHLSSDYLGGQATAYEKAMGLLIALRDAVMAQRDKCAQAWIVRGKADDALTWVLGKPAATQTEEP